MLVSFIYSDDESTNSDLDWLDLGRLIGLDWTVQDSFHLDSFGFSLGFHSFGLFSSPSIQLKNPFTTPRAGPRQNTVPAFWTPPAQAYHHSPAAMDPISTSGVPGPTHT